MKIFSAALVRQWDAFTIANEPVSSINLMERAATACYNWLTTHLKVPTPFAIFCGTGNNGGDGLVIARMLLQAGHTVSVYILAGEKSSEDFCINLERIKPYEIDLNFIDNIATVIIKKDAVLIDALFGTGLNRPLQGFAADLVCFINDTGRPIISIDIPSGLFADACSEENTVIRASHTLSFETNKLAFLMAENNKYTGNIHLLKIGLAPDFYGDANTTFCTIDQDLIVSLYKPRNQFSHKYNFGHALLYAGSKNMMGAAILSAKGCLRSGAGLVTVFTDENTQPIIQTALPEAITATETHVELLSQKKSATGIGPGLALTEFNQHVLHQLIKGYAGPVIIDASALQILSSNIEVLKERRKNTVILTPHTGEFEKLFGKTDNDFERMQLALSRSVELGCYIVLKGHHTLIACPDGDIFFNTTGNAGMATAGSGDVLTGILTGLTAQGHSPKDSCILGVYLHGVAGDVAAEKMSQEAMIAGDITDCIGEAYKKITPPPSPKGELFQGY